MSVAIGKPKTGGKRTTFKLEKDGDNVFRILPPMKSLAEAGKWRVYYPVQWGFKNSKGQNKPFIDPRQVNFQTKMVEVESASFLLRERLKAVKDEVVAAFKEGRATKEDVQKKVDEVKRFNLDGKHYVNVVNLRGEIGLLKLNTKLKNALEAQIKEYKERHGENPIYMGEDGMTGLYFNFLKSNATGALQDWVFQVTPYLENNADGSMKYRTHTMDANFIDRLDAEAFDLAEIYPTPSAEEVERMTNLETLTSNASAVDEILGAGDSGSGSSETSSESAPAASSTPAPTQASAPAATAPVAAAAPTPAPAPTVEAATADAPVQTTTTTPPQPTAETQTVGESLSNEDFLKKIGAM